MAKALPAKALSAIAIAAFIAAALTVVPGFAPQVEAAVPVAATKADRLDFRIIGKDCSKQPACVLPVPKRCPARPG
jgi:hypothetical protein